MTFYEFQQNNSHGKYTLNQNLAETVLIEAESPDDAVQKALAIGIYFDGCDAGLDCLHCGDRWTNKTGDADYQHNSANGEVIKSVMVFRNTLRIHHADGRIESYFKQDRHIMRGVNATQKQPAWRKIEFTANQYLLLCAIFTILNIIISLALRG